MKLFQSPKNSCVDCHFFLKSYRDSNEPDKFVLTEDEREKVRDGDFSWHDDTEAPVALACDMEVWDQGVGGFPSHDRWEFLVNRERKKSCFFRRHEAGMLLSAAKELQRREMIAAEARHDRGLTIAGLFIAAIALAVSMVFQIWNALAK